MLTYPATIPLSKRSLTHLAGLVRRGTRYRRLDPGRQALLVLAHMRNGDTPARLAAGFGIGATTAWRYIREAVDLLAAHAPALEHAMHRIAHLAYAILDGTLVRTDRLSGEQDRRHYAGKHRCHGVNVQVIADPAGRLAWISPALPGSTHDLIAARTHGIVDALTTAQVMTFADKGYRGARGTVIVPFYGRNLPEPMREINRSHAKIRAIGERAIATVKTWKLLTKLHCCPRRATVLLAAIFVLQLVEEQSLLGLMTTSWLQLSADRGPHRGVAQAAGLWFGRPINKLTMP